MTKSLLILFTLLLVAVNINYTIADRRPPTYDDAWYLENSLIFYQRLTEGGLRSFLPAYASSFGTKAPLISVLPIPLYLLLGISQNVALLVNSAFIVITNIFLFLLVRRLFDSAGMALAAVVFYQTMPLAYGLSRAFMADYGLVALILVWLYFLLVSDHLSLPPVNFLLGILLGLGLLLKVTFPAYIAGPLLLSLYQKRNWRALVAMALPAIPMAATWYAFNLPIILRYAWQGAYGEIGAQYAFGGLKHWLFLVVERGLSLYYTAALLIFGLVALALRRPLAPSPPRLPALLAPPGPRRHGPLAQPRDPPLHPPPSRLRHPPRLSRHQAYAPTLAPGCSRRFPTGPLR